MKNTLFDGATAESVIERVKNLSADNKPLWGEMTATEMLYHCNLCNKQIMEEKRGNGKTSFKQYLLRILALYVVANFKKGIKSEGRNDTKGKIEDHKFEEQRQLFIQLIKHFPTIKYELTLTHPAFGNISKAEWGIAAFKHMDYHLRQFSV
jgi:Protein of unknown function (DUF1569)